ncbi:MAG: helix-turn-helix domain-containing protein [Treponema sp.]|nr:helix-turn-helix domain-containing protein [Treponema sp.]
MIKDDNFVHIAGWMINELKLKGNDLLIYSIIHGFSQDGKSDYHGGLSYLAEWTNSSKQGVIKNLKSLIEKGLIVKIAEKQANNTHLCRYFTAKSRENITINNKSKLSLIADETTKEPQNHSTKFNTVQNESGKQSLMGYSTLFNGGIKQSLPNKNSLKEFKNLSSENKIQEIKNLEPEEQNQNQEKQQEQKPEQKEPEKTERQTEISETLKKLFGNTRLFTADFIPKLSKLCAERQLHAEEYINWTYETLQKKNVSNFTGYFFRTILSEPNISKFLFEKTQKDSKNTDDKCKNAPKTKCKCCGAEHPLYNDCPVCGLLLNERDEPEKIAFRRKIYMLPAEMKRDMNSEIQKMHEIKNISAWDTEKNRIYKKYGVI